MKTLTMRILSHWVLVSLVTLSFSCSTGSNTLTGNIPTRRSDEFPLHVLWTYQAEGNLTLPLLYTEELVISRYDVRGTPKHVYIAVDADTGKLMWQYETDGSVGGVDDLVEVVAHQLILGGNRRVEAVGLKSGSRSWVSEGYNAVGSIATSDDTVFVASKKEVTALNAATGVTKWRNTTMPGYSFRVFYDEQTDRVLVTPDTFYVLDAQTGHILSAVDVKGEWNPADCFNALQIHEGRLYCGTMVFDGKTGELVSLGNVRADNYFWFPPIISGTLYTRTPLGAVAAVDIDTMGLKWEYRPTAQPNDKSTEVISRVAVVGTHGYAIAEDATLRAFDLSTGKEIGWWQTSYVADWRPKDYVYLILPEVVSDGQRLYATFGDRTLYAFGP